MMNICGKTNFALCWIYVVRLRIVEIKYSFLSLTIMEVRSLLSSFAGDKYHSLDAQNLIY